MGGKLSKQNQTCFPLSQREKDLVRRTWSLILRDDVRFGNTVFYKLLMRHPNMIDLFPEFTKDNIYLLLNFNDEAFSKGHPKKVVLALHAAVLSIDDSTNFTRRMQALGAKHSMWDLKTEHLKAVSQSLLETIKECLGEEYTKEMGKAWLSFYNFIIANMKAGLNSQIQKLESSKSHVKH